MENNTIITIVTGTLLFISEVLPHIKSIKANGIIESIILICKKYTTQYEEIKSNGKNEGDILKKLEEINLYIKESKKTNQIEK